MGTAASAMVKFGDVRATLETRRPSVPACRPYFGR